MKLRVLRKAFVVFLIFNIVILGMGVYGNEAIDVSDENSVTEKIIDKADKKAIDEEPDKTKVEDSEKTSENSVNTDENSDSKPLVRAVRNIASSQGNASTSTKTLFEILKEKIEAGDEKIVLDAGEYEFTGTLKIPDNKEIVIENSGNVTFKRESSFFGTFIEIGNTSKLTLKSEDKSLVFDGENKKGRSLKNETDFIHTEGTLLIDGAIFKNAKGEGGIYKAPIKAKGEGACIELNSGEIINNDYSGANTAYSAGAIFIDNGAKLTINGGLIKSNQASNYSYPGLSVWSDSPGAGGIMIAHGGELVMNGGEISENKGWGGGILLGSGSPYTYKREATDEAQLQNVPLAKAIFNGGTINKNSAVGGGGISANGNIQVDIPENSALIVENNRAYQGGGIFVSDWAVDGIGLDKEIAKLPIETWSRYYAGKLNMAGGIVRGNIAQNCGGGINVSSNSAYLTGGKIDGNTAGDQGGGIYLTTIPYTLKIEKAFIADNAASGRASTVSDGIFLPSGSGGGVWFCPTGSATFYAENGVTIVDNTARTAGDDFWSSQKVSGSAYSVTLPDRLISGTGVEYFKDYVGNRYSENNAVKETVVNSNKQLALKSVLNDDEKMVAKELSTLIITNNIASKGGGIGSNGNVLFGKVPDKDSKEKSIVIKKTWEKGLEKKEIEIELRVKVSGYDYLIEKFNLNEENNYTYTVTGLPEKINQANVEDIVYVKELQSDEYDVKVTPIKNTDTENKAFEIVIKNNKKALTKVDLPVSKKWIGKKMDDAPEIKVYLVKNGIRTEQFITLNKANGFRGSFDDLPERDTWKSAKNMYSVVEDGEKEGKVSIGEETYEVKYDNGNIVNHLITPKETPTKKSPQTEDSRNIFVAEIILILSSLAIATIKYKSEKKR